VDEIVEKRFEILIECGFKQELDRKTFFALGSLRTSAVAQNKTRAASIRERAAIVQRYAKLLENYSSEASSCIRAHPTAVAAVVRQCMR
jgi:hypothetical protein